MYLVIEMVVEKVAGEQQIALMVEILVDNINVLGESTKPARYKWPLNDDAPNLLDPSAH